jgi:hypothetical protein
MSHFGSHHFASDTFASNALAGGGVGAGASSSGGGGVGGGGGGVLVDVGGHWTGDGWFTDRALLAPPQTRPTPRGPTRRSRPSRVANPREGHPVRTQIVWKTLPFTTQTVGRSQIAPFLTLPPPTPPPAPPAPTLAGVAPPPPVVQAPAHPIVRIVRPSWVWPLVIGCGLLTVVALWWGFTRRRRPARRYTAGVRRATARQGGRR